MCCKNDESFGSLLDVYANTFLTDMLGDKTVREKMNFGQMGKQAYKFAGNVMKARAQVLAKFDSKDVVEAE